MVSSVEDTIQELIDYELFDDGIIISACSTVAIILAEESNNIQRDTKWLLLIGKALYNKGQYYRCILCLSGCTSVESMYLE